MSKHSEPAFASPLSYLPRDDGTWEEKSYAQEGLTKREYVATHLLAALLMNRPRLDRDEYRDAAEMYSRMAVATADKLLDACHE